MPYISKKRAGILDTHIDRVETYGELNYLYTKEYIKLWKVSPGYATFHTMRESVESPYLLSSIGKLTDDLLRAQIYATFIHYNLRIARQEAVNEFRRRVMFKYEDKKRKDKNNVDPYRGIKI